MKLPLEAKFATQPEVSGGHFGADVALVDGDGLTVHTFSLSMPVDIPIERIIPLVKDACQARIREVLVSEYGSPLGLAQEMFTQRISIV